MPGNKKRYNIGDQLYYAGINAKHTGHTGFVIGFNERKANTDAYKWLCSECSVTLFLSAGQLTRSLEDALYS